ncbi:ASCH domain-containing protein [Yersinia pekkanenii]|uniref:ASCH domain n=1 Tax=Yersinia pekkanenii TaxID=1288385 RepID=A0A0T9QQ31_9GAMM|nr:ASCH domain-containing protein [Yersinia pekkanenii]CNI22723.1 ASCH domain [Yersinia pekkanenii]CRY66357.1 ASCH domain [Yersinia pekkanenii]
MIMDVKLTHLTDRYPGALSWSFGDSPELADELVALVVTGKKTASCGSLHSFENEEEPPSIGSYSIILGGNGKPICVIRTVALRLIRFSDVTAGLASQEGEGDLSLGYWRAAHRAFFERAGVYSDDMELVFEQFELIEVL